MKQMISSTIAVLVAVLLVSSCAGGVTKEKREAAERLLQQANRQKDYGRILLLADSLENARCLSGALADYWRGYACDRLKQRDRAVDYWKKAMERVEQQKGRSDMDTYAKAASRLANQLSLDGDYEGTLKMAVPAVEWLEELQCDTTSDYVNLLIYIGCCQAATGQKVEETNHGFYRAYKKHLENIERKHTDAAYKDAIAGLINVAYYCVQARKYEEALYYTRFFGELLGEYQQRPDISADYVDRQLGRYDIYKAQALAATGQREEATKVFETFQTTKFSQTPEGQALAAAYLRFAQQE